MSICELSFQSQTPLQSVPYQEHQLRFKIAIAPEQLSSELGKLASRLSRQTRTPIVANSGQCSLLSPRSLRGDSAFEILSVSSVDLSSQSYHRQLKQVLNQSLEGTFCSYPAKALNRRRLLAKPTQISTVVFYPENAKQSKVTAWCESFASFVNEFEIQLQLQEYRTYTQGDTLSIQRSCRNADKFDLALLFVPDQERFENSRQHDPYPIFKRELVKIMLLSQAIESSTFRDGFSNYQRGTIRPKFNQSIGYNLLLGILGKLGYSAWQLKGIPGEAQAFLGLDVGRKNGVAVGVAAFIVSPQGQVIGWFPAHFQAHRETFDRSALRDILFSLVNLYEEKQETPLRHLVVHRDGRFQANELELFDELLPELKQAGIEKFDAVEVLKSDYTRMGEWQPQAQQWENPRRGWMFPIGENEVALMTTGKTEIKGGTNFVPRPLRVRRRRGETSPGFLASQVYWLSEMHIGSTSTVRLPITTYYPDLAAEYALEGLLPSGLQKGCHLPL